MLGKISTHTNYYGKQKKILIKFSTFGSFISNVSTRLGLLNLNPQCFETHFEKNLKIVKERMENGENGSSKGLKSSKLSLINEGEFIENVSEIIFTKYLKLNISLTLATHNHKSFLKKS